MIFFRYSKLRCVHFGVMIENDEVLNSSAKTKNTAKKLLKYFSVENLPSEFPSSLKDSSFATKKYFENVSLYFLFC